SLNDCFALVMAETTADAVLLTGDQRLRRVAEQLGVVAHGILWLLDQLLERGAVDPAILRDALRSLVRDPAVRLPAKEVERRIHTLTKRLENL
ncbi:MAG: type II toxin-antitoxin system VapC family toxin, partial [Candidatus Competibacter sp.]|nr:type II toxin-antitoxin system VapC family toxin [Candidatus Competibacter sp.]